MRRPKQLQFPGFKRLPDSFGGSLLKNSHAKTKRPLEDKFPVLLTLRSAQSILRLPKNLKLVNQTVYRVCKKHGIRVYEYENVGNHLHLLIRITRVRHWRAFIRELTGRLAQLVQRITGQQKGFKKFWSQRPHTLIIRSWKKGFKNVKAYMELNFLEAQGFISRKDFKTLRDFRQFLVDW